MCWINFKLWFVIRIMTLKGLLDKASLNSCRRVSKHWRYLSDETLIEKKVKKNIWKQAMILQVINRTNKTDYCVYSSVNKQYFDVWFCTKSCWGFFFYWFWCNVFPVGEIWWLACIFRVTPHPGSTLFMPRSVRSQCPLVKRKSMMNLCPNIKWYKDFGALHTQLNTVLQWRKNKNLLCFKSKEQDFDSVYKSIKTKMIRLEEKNVYCGMYNVLVLLKR